MARKKSEEEPCGNWMDTYGDMVTLLLTFFVMLFSMSSVNEDKWQKLVLAFTNNGDETQQVILDTTGDGDQMIDTNRGDAPPPGKGDSLETLEELPQDFDELYKYLKTYVEQNNMESSVSVEKGIGAVYIRFQDNILFDPDSPDLKSSSAPLLDFLGNGLVSVEDQILTVNINGHTAAVPGFENYQVSDWKLSGSRAASVAIYMEEKKGFDPQKLLPIGYGKNAPIGDNNSEEGRRKNRRVDMMVISNQTEMSSETALKNLLEGTYDPDKYPTEAKSTADLLKPDSAASSSSSSETSSSNPPPASSSPQQQETPPTYSEPSDNPVKDVVIPAEEDEPASAAEADKNVSPYADG